LIRFYLADKRDKLDFAGIQAKITGIFLQRNFLTLKKIKKSLGGCQVLYWREMCISSNNESFFVVKGRIGIRMSGIEKIKS